MPFVDNKIFLVVQSNDTEQILQIIERAVGYELHTAGINDINKLDESTCQAEHDAAIAAINHHHDVLYQRGVNSGLKGVCQLGVGGMKQFEIEEGSDTLKRIVALVEQIAKTSLWKESGLRGAEAPSNGDVFGTSKKAKEGALIAALQVYWDALRVKAWEMAEKEKKEDGGEKSGEGEGEGTSGGKEEERDPEDLALSSEDEV
ncbi:hypothetical protein CLAFUW4_10619 [Fulvia fulva]|nr:hypothetical protein CLAFUR4_10624 [Fulvia fulva]WPV18934.1 hypothetical protein CLAFUW4_10619 [Fulvia fulva]WPV33994.1 hypothetical protein CLAFUW7_10621 [Fulvia fulva]